MPAQEGRAKPDWQRGHGHIVPPYTVSQNPHRHGVDKRTGGVGPVWRVCRGSACLGSQDSWWPVMTSMHSRQIGINWVEALHPTQTDGSSARSVRNSIVVRVTSSRVCGVGSNLPRMKAWSIAGTILPGQTRRAILMMPERAVRWHMAVESDG